MGNDYNKYKTAFQSDFEIKEANKSGNKLSSKDFENVLRSHSYIMGNDKLDYKSETKIKFSSQNNNENYK